MRNRKNFVGGVLPALETMSAFLALAFLVMACEPDSRAISGAASRAGAIHTVEWTPDGSQIVYSAGIDYGRSIYVAAADGSRVRAVARGGSGRSPRSNVSPRISPDGSRVAYAGLVKTGLFGINGYGWEIFTSRIDGSDRRRLTNNTVTDTNPTWSPDGSRIVFASHSGHAPHYSMSADGSDVRALTGPLASLGVVWSPDSQSLAMVAGERDVYGLAIYITDSDASDARRIAHTYRTSSTTSLSWSPDSERLVFIISDREVGSGSIGGRDEGVYTVKADGADLRQIVSGADLPDTDWIGAQVAWSPDGSEILLAGDGALFVFRPDGIGLRRLHAEPSGYAPSGEKYNYDPRRGVRTRAAHTGRGLRSTLSSTMQWEAGSLPWRGTGRT